MWDQQEKNSAKVASRSKLRSGYSSKILVASSLFARRSPHIAAIRTTLVWKRVEESSRCTVKATFDGSCHGYASIFGTPKSLLNAHHSSETTGGKTAITNVAAKPTLQRRIVSCDIGINLHWCATCLSRNQPISDPRPPRPSSASPARINCRNHWSHFRFLPPLLQLCCSCWHLVELMDE